MGFTFLPIGLTNWTSGLQVEAGGGESVSGALHILKSPNRPPLLHPHEIMYCVQI